MRGNPEGQRVDQKLLKQHFSSLVELLDGLNCGLVGADTDRIILFANQKVCDWLGYTHAELNGRPAGDLVPDELRPLLEADRESVLAGDIRARLGVLKRRDGSTFPTLMLPHVVRDADDNFTGVVHILIELATVQTAKPLGGNFGMDVRAELNQLALQIQSIGLASGATTPTLSFSHPSLAELSAREREVLVELASGGRVPAIAKKLFISPHTVRNHLKSVFRKVGVGNQAELIERVRQLTAVDRA